VSEEVNRKLPARKTTVQLLTLYTDPEHHNAQRYRWTDGQTDDTMMPRANHSAAWSAKTVVVVVIVVAGAAVVVRHCITNYAHDTSLASVSRKSQIFMSIIMSIMRAFKQVTVTSVHTNLCQTMQSVILHNKDTSLQTYKSGTEPQNDSQMIQNKEDQSTKHKKHSNL